MGGRFSSIEWRDEIKKSEKQVDRARGKDTRGMPTFIPQIDIYEDPNNITVIADMPGVDKDAVACHVLDKLDAIERCIDKLALVTSPGMLKTIAFQAGQTLGFIDGKELYTKGALSSAYPVLEPYLYRHASSGAGMAGFVMDMIDAARAAIRDDRARVL